MGRDTAAVVVVVGKVADAAVVVDVVVDSTWCLVGYCVMDGLDQNIPDSGIVVGVAGGSDLNHRVGLSVGEDMSHVESTDNGTVVVVVVVVVVVAGVVHIIDYFLVSVFDL